MDSAQTRVADQSFVTRRAKDPVATGHSGPRFTTRQEPSTANAVTIRGFFDLQWFRMQRGMQ